MAITPKQARGLSKKEKATISKLEKEIDKTISNEFQSQSSRVIYPLPDNSGPYDTGESEISGRVIQAITKTYQEAGWNVKYENSQLDGERFEFTPAPANICDNKFYRYIRS